MHRDFNPLYANINVNEQWVEAATANDKELYKHLVRHDDEDMDTECEQPRSDGCDSPTNVAVSVESELIECSNYTMIVMSFP